MNNLLEPRYKVIANYPNSLFEVGDVLKFAKESYLLKEYVRKNEYSPAIYIEEAKKYPHLFREMAWYEGLTEKEMPSFLKINGSKTVIKVKEYNMRNSLYYTENGSYWTLTNSHLPATAQEYNDYIYSLKA